MRYHFFRAVLVVALAASPIAAQPAKLNEISEAALRSNATALRSFVPKDQFSSRPDFSQLDRRTFRISLPVRAWSAASQVCTGTPIYQYSAQEQILKIAYGNGEYDPEPVSTSDPVKSADNLINVLRVGLPSLFAIDCANSRREEMRTNGFGARFRVEVTNERYTAIEATNLTSGGIGHKILTLPMQGDKARQLVRNLRIIVGGRLVGDAGKQLLTCDSKASRARADFPIHRNANRCRYQAMITELKIIDASNGAVLENIVRDEASTLNAGGNAQGAP